MKTAIFFCLQAFLAFSGVASEVTGARVVLRNKNDYWKKFKVDFAKNFESPHAETLRKNIFFKNLDTIAHHNFEFRRGRSSYKMDINQFSDMTFEEFSELFKASEEIKKKNDFEVIAKLFKPKEIIFSTEESKNATNLPEAFDWREQGAVTAAKDQGFCGSCYAMSTVAAIESHHFIATGQLLELSSQQVIDCTKQFNGHGCKGGVAFQVFEYVKHNGGLSLLSDYPYEERAAACRSYLSQVELDVQGFGYIAAENDDKILMKALVEKGPIMISIDSDHESFMRYSKGILYEKNCTETVTHGVLLVGYGTEKGEDFWIVKNSFGEKWGESGFFRIARKEKACNVGSAPLYPIIGRHNDVEQDS